MTPFELLSSNIDSHRSGALTGSAWLTALAEADRFVQGYARQLQSMEDLPGVDVEALQRLREAGVAKFAEALAQLRKTEDPETSQIDEALKLAGQADFLFGEALSRTSL